MWIVAAAQLIGLRGAVGMAAGAMIAAAPSYALGKWTEEAAAGERLARVLAEETLRRAEVENGRVDAAVAARIGAYGGAGGGGVPDDGFRRD